MDWTGRNGLNRPKWTEPAEMDKNRPKRRGFSPFRPLVRSRATGDPRTTKRDLRPPWATEIESHREPPRSRATESLWDHGEPPREIREPPREIWERSESHRWSERDPREIWQPPAKPGSAEITKKSHGSHQQPPHTSSNPKLARNKKDYQEQQRTTQ